MVAAETRRKRWRSIAARHLREYGSSASVEEALAALAREALEGLPCPPTDIDAVCAKAGIVASASDEMIGAGALVSDNGKLRIIYATDLPLARRRFTIAHELGHAVVGKVVGTVIPPSKELERLCDVYATEVLLPKPVFLGMINDSFHVSMMSALARSFQASLTSTAIRYAELKNVSIFEVAEDRVRWGIGLVRRGFISRMDESLMFVTSKALSGETGTDQVYLTVNNSIRSCRVEYWPLGKTHRALILIRASSLKTG